MPFNGDPTPLSAGYGASPTKVVPRTQDEIEREQMRDYIENVLEDFHADVEKAAQRLLDRRLIQMTTREWSELRGKYDTFSRTPVQAIEDLCARASEIIKDELTPEALAALNGD